MRQLAWIVGLTVILGCARTPAGRDTEGTLRAPSSSLIPQKEEEVGGRIHQTIVSTYRVYTEPRLVDYVNSVGQSLGHVAKRQEFPYRFTVLYDPRVYATEAPGGFVYLTTGFLNFLENEAELAAVLAQEVALLQFRDPRFSGSRSALNVVTQTGAVVAPFFGPFGSLAATGLVLLNAFMESRDADLEAKVEQVDRLTLKYMVEAGHDPQGFFDILRRFLNPDPEWSPYLYDYQASHPASLERYEAALAEFEKLPLEERSFSVNREHYLEMTKGIKEIYRSS